MARRFTRWTAGLLAATLLATTGVAAQAADIQAPWFGDVAPTRISAADSLGMAWSYVSFWRYMEGVAWAQYAELRLGEQALPAAYVTRTATPLPSLPSAPERVVVAVPAVKVTPAPAPAPSPAPVEPDTPAEPAPAPTPEQPAPEPTPPPAKPDPTPSPAPEPVPPAPEPAPAPRQPATSGLTAAEQQMVDLLNAERTKAGLSPLTVDPRLVATARAKSRDMIAGNYFGHDSPTLGSPFDQMRVAGIAYRTAGENLAGNQTVAAAHTALMNSPGHRANILRPEFTRVGIGIVEGGPYGLMVTQQFIGE